MIGSFWNLCRACPSMPIDKQLHSEYRSTYTWHEYTGPHQENTVVRRAPQPPSTKQVTARQQLAKSTEDENTEGPTLEPPLPRRKKCPELAYRHHEFMTSADASGIDAIDTNVVADKVREVTTLPPSQLSKAISRISTEYRLQFAWPRKAQLTNGDAVAALPAAGTLANGPPRKSLSMGALKQGNIQSGPVPVHVKRRPGDVDHKRDGVQPSELEPLVGNNTDNIDGIVPEVEEADEDLNELKVNFRSKKSAGKGVRILDTSNNYIKAKKDGIIKDIHFPTSEMIENRRLADEYKHRDWGCGLASEEEASLWKRVSNNHALNALSLARSATKEEKDKENTRKIAPVSNTMPAAGRPSSVQAKPIYDMFHDDLKMDNEKAIAKARKEFLIRHHLDRTTGVGDGALLPSPTREKLEPVVPRRRDESKEVRDEIQPRPKSSPKSSPRSGRSQSLGPISRSPKRQTPRTPSLSKDAKEKEKESKEKDKEMRDRSSEPERHPRPTVGERVVRWSIRESESESSKSPAISSSTSEPPIPPLPPPPSGLGPTPIHRRPSPRARRKPFLATSAPPHRPLHHAKNTTNVSNTTSAVKAPLVKHSIHQSAGSYPDGMGPNYSARSISSTASSATTVASGSKSDRVNKYTTQNEKRARGAAKVPADPSKSSFDNRNQSYRANAVLQAMTAEPQINGDATPAGESSVASTPSQPAATISAPAATAVITSPWFDDEPVVKSPPEPTRVKSPEQMIMRSPEPVNWTVPLDTGKTFTVTQNVTEGEPPLTRPHSEAKNWGSTTISSTAPQSAPPELAALHKSHPQYQSQHSGCKSPESESISLGSYSGLNGHKDLDSERDSPLPSQPISSTIKQIDKDHSSLDKMTKNEIVENLVKPIAGTNLRCLEDPMFEIEKGKQELPSTASTVTTTTTTSSTTDSGVTQGGYKVLEAQVPPDASTTIGSFGNTGGYQVLEAPTLGSGSTQRSVASDVLEKARNRFDKFWGKGSDNQA